KHRRRTVVQAQHPLNRSYQADDRVGRLRFGDIADRVEHLVRHVQVDRLPSVDARYTTSATAWFHRRYRSHSPRSTTVSLPMQLGRPPWSTLVTSAGTSTM